MIEFARYITLFTIYFCMFLFCVFMLHMLVAAIRRNPDDKKFLHDFFVGHYERKD